MKILMTTMGMNIGGVETHILELSRELVSRGHDVTVASNGGIYVSALEQYGVHHVCLPLNTKRPLAVIRSYKGLEKLITEEKFDVVHAHARIPAFICSMLHKKLGFRFVTTAHGVFNPTPALRAVTRWGQYSLAVSEDIRDYLMKYYNIPSNRITLTINGIDTEKFKKDTDIQEIADIVGPAGHRIVYVSRIDRESAHVAFMLVECAGKIVERYPDAHITIVGDGTAFEDLKRKADEFNKSAGRAVISLTGARTDVNRFMAAADVFVGVSRAAMEAMACETPVILAGSQGYLGIFDETKLDDALDTNFCCREKREASEDKIFDDICSVFSSDGGKLDRLRAFGKDTVDKYYAVSRMADDCLCVYNRVLSDPISFKGCGDVLLSGYYGFGNMGDDSILETIAASLAKKKPDIRITALTRCPRNARKLFGIKCISRMNIFSVIAEMRGAKLLISGGGSLFQDSTSSKSLLYYTFIVRLAKLMGMKTYIYANGVGVIYSERNRRITAKVVSRADAVTVRDTESMNELVSVGVPADKIKCTADPAFMITPSSGENLQSALRRYGIDKNREYFAISLRRFEGSQKKAYDEEVLLGELVESCAQIAKKYSLMPMFVIMQPNLDMELSQTAADMLKQKFNIDSLLINPENGAELVGIFGEDGAGVKFVMGMRLHILIYAIAASVPQIGLSLDPKIDAIMNSIDESYLFRIPDVSKADIMSSVDEIMENREHIKESVLDASARFKSLAESDVLRVIDLLKE